MQVPVTEQILHCYPEVSQFSSIPPAKYLYSTKSASSQILSNSSVINPHTIQHYITRYCHHKKPTHTHIQVIHLKSLLSLLPTQFPYLKFQEYKQSLVFTKLRR
jgi:hypothetical protein